MRVYDTMLSAGSADTGAAARTESAPAFGSAPGRARGGSRDAALAAGHA